MNVIFIILIFQFLIFVHELGHFLAARRCGIEVEEFSLGIPPKILTKKIGKTLYCLSLLPIGGYVKIKGFVTNENSQDSSNFVSKSIWQRFTVIFAGPLFNVALTYLLLIFVFWFGLAQPIVYSLPPIIGKVTNDSVELAENDLILQVNNITITNWGELDALIAQTPKNQNIPVEVQRNNQVLQLQILVTDLTKVSPRIAPVVGSVLKDSEAERIGIKIGDRILTINNQKINDWGDISLLLQQQGSKQGVLVLERSTREKIKLSFLPKWQQNSKKWVLGISLPATKIHYSFLQSFQKSAEAIHQNITSTFIFLGKLLIGKSSSDALGGPVTIFAVINQSINNGFVNLLYITAMISLQLAIFNLLPIPALDGGHILLLIIEKIKGKSLSLQFRKKIQFIGFALLFTLLIFVTTKDIGRFW